MLVAMDPVLSHKLQEFAALDEEAKLTRVGELDNLAIERDLEGDTAAVRAIYQAIAACDPPESSAEDLLAALLGHLSDGQDEATTLDPGQVGRRLGLGLEDEARDIIDRARAWLAEN